MNRFFITLFAAVLLNVLSAVAAETKPTLFVGDPAPKLQVGKWVQGEPVKEFQPGKTYMVEFWATWCGPCRTTIPHINELHNKFKDKGFVVIGQDVWETDESKVEPFVKEMGSKMTYRVALDDKNGSAKGKMAETWMTAAGRNGIPSAFLVNKDGKIAWIGHPMSLKEDLLVKVMDGTYDLKKAAAEYALTKKNEIAKDSIWKQFRAASTAREWDKAEAALTEMDKLATDEEKANFSLHRFNLAVSRNDLPAAYKVAREISDAPKVNPMLLNEFAWSIATDKKIKDRDLALAEKIAHRANKETKGANAEILDTYARVYALKGNMKMAVELQEKAVSAAKGSRATTFQKVLDAYKAGKLPE